MEKVDPRTRALGRKVQLKQIIPRHGNNVQFAHKEADEYQCWCGSRHTYGHSGTEMLRKIYLVEVGEVSETGLISRNWLCASANRQRLRDTMYSELLEQIRLGQSRVRVSTSWSPLPNTKPPPSGGTAPEPAQMRRPPLRRFALRGARFRVILALYIPIQTPRCAVLRGHWPCHAVRPLPATASGEAAEQQVGVQSRIPI